MDQENVLNLMRGAFHARPKTKQRHVRPALLLDQTVLNTRTPDSRFLSLPNEILASIVDLLAEHRATVANLALVNSECNQLARTRQFCEVHFDYSPPCRALIERLLVEGQQQLAVGRRGRNNAPMASIAASSSIGSCIRRVTMSSDPDEVAVTHYDLWKATEQLKRQPTSDRNFRSSVEYADMHSRAERAYSIYRDRALLAIVTAMPNLEDLIWEDDYLVDLRFFSSLQMSAARNLKLKQIPVQTPAILTGGAWPLRSLWLDVSMFSHYMNDRGDTTRSVDPFGFMHSILRLCSPTLESIYISGSTLPLKILDHGSLSFPRLRRLRFVNEDVVTADTLLFFLSQSLREFELPFCSRLCWPALESKFEHMQACRNLETVVWTNVEPQNAAASMRFLAKHKQIRKLMLPPSDHAELQHTILPYLASGVFSKLISLSVAWEDSGMKVNQINSSPPPQCATISDFALATIGRIYTLQQLCIQAGCWAGWRCQWLVDHDNLRFHLRNLKGLKRLALCRDSYKFAHSAFVEEYYAVRDPNLLDKSRVRERTFLDREMGWFEIVKRSRTEKMARQRREARSMFAEVSGSEGMLEDDHSNLAYDDWTYTDQWWRASSETEGAYPLPFMAVGPDGFMTAFCQDEYHLLDPGEVWELCHRNFILLEAEKYAAALPQLRWVYAGQWSMHIKIPGDGSFGNAVPAGEARENIGCRHSPLEIMFGLRQDMET